MRNQALAIALLMASIAPAGAQTAWVEARDTTIVAPFELTADAVEDMDVVDAAGRKIGEIDEVIGPSADEPTALVVDFEDDAGYAVGNEDEIIVPLAGFELQGSKLLLLGDAATIRGYEIYRGG